MILDSFKEQAALMYETVREVYQDRLVRLDTYIATYKEAGDLADLDEEELEGVLPQVILQQKEVQKVVEKLNNVATRDWFVEMISSQIDEKVTEEDGEILNQALEIQTRLDDIFEEGSDALVGYLTKDLGDKVVIN